MVIRALYTKTNELKYLSHLDMVRLIERAFRRCDIALNYSQGYHPAPKIAFSPPIALGIESYAELMEADIDYKQYDTDQFINKLNDVLPNGCRIVWAKELLENEKRMSKCRLRAEYEVIFDYLACDEIVISISKVFESDNCYIKKVNKGGKIINTDIRDKIFYLDTYENKEGKAVLRCVLDSSQNSILSPFVLLTYLKENCFLNVCGNYEIIKKDMIIKQE